MIYQWAGHLLNNIETKQEYNIPLIPSEFAPTRYITKDNLDSHCCEILSQRLDYAQDQTQIARRRNIHITVHVKESPKALSVRVLDTIELEKVEKKSHRRHTFPQFRVGMDPIIVVPAFLRALVGTKWSRRPSQNMIERWRATCIGYLEHNGAWNSNPYVFAICINKEKGKNVPPPGRGEVYVHENDY
jgi:hypothetical protein